MGVDAFFLTEGGSGSWLVSNNYPTQNDSSLDSPPAEVRDHAGQMMEMGKNASAPLLPHTITVDTFVMS